MRPKQIHSIIVKLKKQEIEDLLIMISLEIFESRMLQFWVTAIVLNLGKQLKIDFLSSSLSSCLTPELQQSFKTVKMML